MLLSVSPVLRMESGSCTISHEVDSFRSCATPQLCPTIWWIISLAKPNLAFETFRAYVSPEDTIALLGAWFAISSQLREFSPVRTASTIMLLQWVWYLKVLFNASGWFFWEQLFDASMWQYIKWLQWTNSPCNNHVLIPCKFMLLGTHLCKSLETLRIDFLVQKYGRCMHICFGTFGGSPCARFCGFNACRCTSISLLCTAAQWWVFTSAGTLVVWGGGLYRILCFDLTKVTLLAIYEQ